MADAKISQLTEATPAGADYVPFVDTSDTTMGPSGSTRKARVDELPFDSTGTATAAVAAHEAAADPHPQYTTGAEVLAALASALTGYQPLDSDLTAISALATTSFGRALLTLADAAAARTTLGVPAGSGTSTGTNTGDQNLSGYATTAAVAAGYQPLDADLTAIAALATTTYGRALLTMADAAALRVALALATIARGVIMKGSLADGTVAIEAKAAFAYTLSQILGLKLASGSCTLKIQINGVDVTGLTGLSVTTSAQDATATAARTVAAGDRVTMVISSSSSPADLEFTLSATR